MPITTVLSPDDLDLEAAALYDTAAWQPIVSHWATTAPKLRAQEPKRPFPTTVTGR
ncbi:hypothetical protein ACF05T_28275 [Streptomyces lateritius]|uniref:GNAT family N-acetyltransferase n=1 Tax=Streptomyces lateritius TaxID=67313 RepID=A0ABW6YK36_9ACTN